MSRAPTREESLLLSGRNSFIFLKDKDQRLIKKHSNTPNLLETEEITPRVEKDIDKSGFFLQMTTDYTAEKTKYSSGRISLAPAARGRTRLKWMKVPRLVQIVKRPGDGELLDIFWRVVKYLNKQDIKFVIEEEVVNDIGSEGVKKLFELNGYLSKNSKIDEEPIDFIVVLGGDGTMIWTSNTHQNAVPPIVAFNLGSLGFLTPFDPNRCEKVLETILFKPELLLCSIRSRASISLFKKGKTIEKRELITSGRVLNEALIDRGPQSHVVDLEVSINNKIIGNVQGDGLLISTPTGSTAYSVMAGGSLIHPGLSALAVTPICCKPLNFKPFVVSDNQNIRIALSENARNSAWVSFDGARRTEIHQDEYVECRFSKYPLIWFCSKDDNEDWLNSIEESFNINEKRDRKPISISSGL